MTINWGGEGYPEYQGYCKITGEEKRAHAQSVQESQFLQNMMQTQFSEQQGLLNNFLIPQLKQMASDPQGFGAKALADMQSQLINTVGSQFASQTKGLQERFATQNLAGLPSGVQAALQAQLGQGAAGMEATGIQNIQLANEQAKLQQQQFGLSGLGGATQLLGAAPQSAGLALSASKERFGQAYQMAQQGSLWQNLLGGVIGSGLNMAASYLTGGASQLAFPGMSAGQISGSFGGPTEAPTTTSSLPDQIS